MNQQPENNPLANQITEILSGVNPAGPCIGQRVENPYGFRTGIIVDVTPENVRIVWDADYESTASHRALEHFKMLDHFANPAEIDDAIRRVEYNRLREQENKEAERAAVTAERERIRKEYPYLETADNTKKSAHALAAANLRKQLRREFPGVKFSVRAKSYSMGSSLRVEIPADANVDDHAVEKIAGAYAYGSFNGMDDSYNYAAGVAAVWGDTFGSTKYVFVQRNR